MNSCIIPEQIIVIIINNSPHRFDQIFGLNFTWASKSFLLSRPSYEEFYEELELYTLLHWFCKFTRTDVSGERSKGSNSNWISYTFLYCSSLRPRFEGLEFETFPPQSCKFTRTDASAEGSKGQTSKRIAQEFFYCSTGQGSKGQNFKHI